MLVLPLSVDLVLIVVFVFDALVLIPLEVDGSLPEVIDFLARSLEPFIPKQQILVPLQVLYFLFEVFGRSLGDVK